MLERGGALHGLKSTVLALSEIASFEPHDIIICRIDINAPSGPVTSLGETAAAATAASICYLNRRIDGGGRESIVQFERNITCPPCWPRFCLESVKCEVLNEAPDGLINRIPGIWSERCALASTKRNDNSSAPGR